MMTEENKNDLLLDHNYDGIRELDNKLPPWWLYLFYVTIVWGIGYLIYYHVLGIGDLSRAEYMKEMDPSWKPSVPSEGFSIGYHSPWYRSEDLTPRSRLAIAKAEEAAILPAEAEIGDKGTALSGLDFNQLILAAMKVSEPEDLEKLKNAFPAIWSQYEAMQSGASSIPDAASGEPEPEAEIEPLTDEASLMAGLRIFEANCVTCHGKNGEGGIGPNLTDDYYMHGKGMTNTVNIIVNGIPAKGMISWRGILNKGQINQVASYILTLHGTNPPNAKAPQGEKIEIMN